MTTLVLGAGMLGTHVAGHLRSSAQGRSVYILDAAPDMRYLSAVAQLGPECVKVHRVERPADLLQQVEPLACSHLVVAAGSLGPAYRTRPDIAVANDVSLLLAICGLLHALPLRQVVFASSLAVYGGQPASEQRRPQPATHYGLAKLYAECMLAETARETGVPVTMLRFAGTLGPAAERSGNWISAAFRQAVAGTGVISVGQEFTPGHEYLDARDAAAATALALFRQPQALVEVFNVGRGHAATREELADVLRRLTGRTVECTGNTPVHGTPPFSLDIARARELLGYVPQHGLEETVKYTLTTIHKMATCTAEGGAEQWTCW